MIKKNILNPKYKYLLPLKTKSIRVGSNFDGGYIIREQDINLIEEIISFGMGSDYEDWSFEWNFLEKKKVEIYYYDHTVSIKNYISNIFKTFRRIIKLRYKFEKLSKELLNFYKYIKLIKFNKINHLKKRICSSPESVFEVNPKKIFSNIKSNKILLKIDIEGGEYDIIDDIFDYHEKLVSILIEFHNINILEKKFEEKIKKLKSKFEIVHLHGNNNGVKISDNLPTTLEVTFVNKKYINEKIEKKYNYDFPIKGLDFPNNSSEPDLSFSFEQF